MERQKLFELQPGQTWNAELRMGEKLVETLEVQVTDLSPEGQVGVRLDSGHKYTFPKQDLEQTGRCGMFCLRERVDMLTQGC